MSAVREAALFTSSFFMSLSAECEVAPGLLLSSGEIYWHKEGRPLLLQLLQGAARSHLNLDIGF